MKKLKSVTKWRGEPLYKVFEADMSSPYGRKLKWDLPKKSGKPGKWQHHKGAKPLLCERGLHAWVGEFATFQGLGYMLRRRDRRYFRGWSSYGRVFRVEILTWQIDDNDGWGRKVATRGVRLLKEVRPGTKEWDRLAYNKRGKK